MLFQILSATSWKNYTSIIILGIFFVLMIVMTIVPQRKKQKQMQSMLDSLSVGDKIITIGRLIGIVEFIDTEKRQVTVNVGTLESKTLIVIDRNAVGYIVEKSNTFKEDDSSLDSSNNKL